MAHHWSEPGSQMSAEEFNNLFKKDPNEPGATGKFPDGKIDPLDEGEIRIRIGEVEGRVVIEFGKQITSIGFTREQALQIGQNLIQKALDMR